VSNSQWLNTLITSGPGSAALVISAPTAAGRSAASCPPARTAMATRSLQISFSTAAPAASNGATQSTAKRSNASSRHARATSSRAASPVTAWGQRSGRFERGRAEKRSAIPTPQEPWVTARGFLVPSRRYETCNCQRLN